MTAESHNLTDLGNARRLVERHGQDLRFCGSIGWLVYDGRRWGKDETGEVMRCAKETVRGIYAEAEAAENPADRKALAAHAMRSEAEPRLRAMIALAESEPGIPVRPEHLDGHGWLLNVENGTLNLCTGELGLHRREDLLTKLVPVSYDAAARAPLWEAFLARVLAGDAELIAFLQRAFGYALTADVREQVLFILYGTGSNGKTTLLEMMRDTLGDYAQPTRPETLLVKKGDAIPNDVAALRGARLVYACEPEGSKRLAEALVKQLTGGDTVTARFMRREFFSFRPTFKVFFAANHKPHVRGTDHAIWRRVRLVPFTVTIPDLEQDRMLPEKLRGERPGILRWLVQGCLAWQREGLRPPDAVRVATAEYRAEQDALGAFLAECCVAETGATVAIKELYVRYAEWCAEARETPVTKRELGALLEERGFEPDRTKASRLRVGLRLRRDGEPEAAPVRVGADVEWAP